MSMTKETRRLSIPCVDVDMWQKVSDRQEVRYNSQTDKTPPAGIRARGQDGGRPDCHRQGLAVRTGSGTR